MLGGRVCFWLLSCSAWSFLYTNYSWRFLLLESGIPRRYQMLTRDSCLMQSKESEGFSSALTSWMLHGLSSRPFWRSWKRSESLLNSTLTGAVDLLELTIWQQSTMSDGVTWAQSITRLNVRMLILWCSLFQFCKRLHAMFVGWMQGGMDGNKGWIGCKAWH